MICDTLGSASPDIKVSTSFSTMRAASMAFFAPPRQKLRHRAMATDKGRAGGSGRDAMSQKADIQTSVHVLISFSTLLRTPSSVGFNPHFTYASCHWRLQLSTKYTCSASEQNARIKSPHQQPPATAKAATKSLT